MRRTIALICCMCAGVSLFAFSPPAYAHPAEAALPTEPNMLISPTTGVTGIGETFQYEIKDLSFQNSLHGVGGMFLEINLSYNPSARLDQIIFPRFEGISKEPAHGNDITIRVMAFKNSGAVYGIIKEFQFAENDGSAAVTMTREEILSFTEGQMPAAVDIHFIIGQTNRNARIDSLYQLAPIVCEFTTIDGQTLYKETDTYQRYYANLHYYDAETFTNNDYKLITRSAFVHFNTAVLTISVDQTEDLLPGDEVELRFTLTNHSRYHHTNLYVGFLGNNISLSQTAWPKEDVLYISNWGQKGEAYSAAFHNGEKWIVLKAGETLEFRQKIIIAEDFTGSSIDITAFEYHHYNKERRWGNTVTLNLQTSANTIPPTGQEINDWLLLPGAVALLVFLFFVRARKKAIR